MLFKNILSKLLQIPINKSWLLDSEQIRNIQLTNIISCTYALMTIPFGAIFFYGEFYLSTAFIGFYLITMLSVPLLSSWGYYLTARLTLLLLTNSIIIFFSYFFGSETHIHWLLVGMLVTPNLLFSSLNKKTLSAFVICLVAPAFALIFLNTRLPPRSIP